MSDSDDPWRSVAMPRDLRDSLRRIIDRVGTQAEIGKTNWPSPGHDRSGYLSGVQVAALECLLAAVEGMTDRDLKAFLRHGDMPE